LLLCFFIKQGEGGMGYGYLSCSGQVNCGLFEKTQYRIINFAEKAKFHYTNGFVFVDKWLYDEVFRFAIAQRRRNRQVVFGYFRKDDGFPGGDAFTREALAAFYAGAK